MPVTITYEKNVPIQKIAHTDAYGDTLIAERVGNSLFISQAVKFDSDPDEVHQDFTPQEAREFAQALIKLADQIDAEE